MRIISKTFDSKKSIDSIKSYDFCGKSDKSIRKIFVRKGNDGNFSRLSNRDFVFVLTMNLSWARADSLKAKLLRSVDNI